MNLGENILKLRKELGYSQEELAELINVTRQTISNWELGTTSPNPSQLKELSTLLNISVDELLDNHAFINTKKEKNTYGYEFISKTKIKGVPLVHINLGLGRGIKKAKGIIAVGNIGEGLIALGGISIGLFSLGGVSLGLISLGGFALGLLLALGGLSIGTIALGGIALGLFAIGGVTIGIYSVGGLAIAKNVASGDYAYGHIAIGNYVKGTIELISSTTSSEIKRTILEQFPKTWNIIIWIFSHITY